MESWHHKDLHLTLHAAEPQVTPEQHTAAVAQSHQPYSWQLSCPSTIPQHSKAMAAAKAASAGSHFGRALLWKPFFTFLCAGGENPTCPLVDMCHVAAPGSTWEAGRGHSWRYRKKASIRGAQKLAFSPACPGSHAPTTCLGLQTEKFWAFWDTKNTAQPHLFIGGAKTTWPSSLPVPHYQRVVSFFLEEDINSNSPGIKAFLLKHRTQPQAVQPPFSTADQTSPRIRTKVYMAFKRHKMLITTLILNIK